MKNLIYIFIIFVLSVSIGCSRSKTKDKIGKGGEIVGKTVGEFFEGVATGVDQVTKIEINLSKELDESGIDFGRIVLTNADTGYDNLVSTYIIFQKDFKDTLLLKAFDKDSLEIGRSTLYITGEKDQSDYYDFKFNKRSNIDRNSILIMTKK